MPPTRLAALAACCSLVVGVAAVRGANLTIYDDALVNDWSYAGWATVYDPDQTAIHHGGSKAIAWEPDNWEGLQFQHDGLQTRAYLAIRLWSYSAAGGQQVTVEIQDGFSRNGSQKQLTLPAGWSQITVPFTDLAPDGAYFDLVVIQGFNWPNEDQATAYIDDLELVENPVPPPPPAPISVTVAPLLDRRAIDPLIYGVNFAPADRIAPVGYTVNRWGGNSTTREDWLLGWHNTASDWFFMNVEDDTHPDTFIDQTRAGGAQPLMTVGTIGWAPDVDLAQLPDPKRWGFSIAKYGAQDSNECAADGGSPWCKGDAGNGMSGNVPIVGNDPLDTSKAVDEAYATDWMAHVAAHLGGQTAATGGVRFWALDNETNLWSSTHRDVHPDRTTYDEIWEYTARYGAAMKAQDPAAKIFGPVTWGWCDLWSSDADQGGVNNDCTDGPDRAAQPWGGAFQPCAGCDLPADKGVPLVPWYMHQVCSNPIGGGPANGKLLVDYLDVHYYPQGSGVDGLAGNQSTEDSSSTIARRDRSLKELWDPAWTAESWVANSGIPVRLLRRLAQWRDAYCPAMKLALTEYSWGKSDTPSGALSQAEVLAIFGREKLDLATRWVAPKGGNWVEESYKLYRNYDGAGAKIDGETTRATSSDVDAVGSYAIVDANVSGRLWVLLFNRDTQARDVTVSVAGGGVSGTVALWQFDATQKLHTIAGVASTATGFALIVPPRSATLARVSAPVGAGAIFGDGFESGGPAQWSGGAH